MPEEVARRLGKVRDVVAQFWQENGQAPQPAQIAQASQIQLDEVLQLLGLIEQPISLDMSVDEETHFSLADTLADRIVATRGTFLAGEPPLWYTSWCWEELRNRWEQWRHREGPMSRA
ncbi:MAG TPA: sigma-70 domain-containing protein, partial [Ktedonobacteraceae bacterium]